MTLSTSYIDPRCQCASSLSNALPPDHFCEGEQQIGNGSGQCLTKGRPKAMCQNDSQGHPRALQEHAELGEHQRSLDNAQGAKLVVWVPEIMS